MSHENNDKYPVKISVIKKNTENFILFDTDIFLLLQQIFITNFYIK